MKNLLYPNSASTNADVGLLILRVIAGAGLAQHGWPKIQHAFNWMGPDAPVPGILQALAALAEFGGGLALIVGLLTPFAALGIACTMLTALGMVHLPRGDAFVDPKGGPSYELAAVYLGIALLLLLAGPGRFSLDALLFRRGTGAGPVTPV
ncbi:MAG: DoxX family protein [Verrucomicrobiota bacterium]|nr:DoxX family protein [Verrucomicrobiota bacterium]